MIDSFFSGNAKPQNANSQCANPQNGQAHSKDSSVTAGELFECVWPFCGIGA